jgi:mono/diheme cytochrome c family protein
MGWIALGAGMGVAIAAGIALRSLAAAPAGGAAPDAAGELESGPRVVRAAEAGIGRLVPDLVGKDLSGKSASLTQLAGPKGLVLAVISSSCPVSKRLAPVLGKLEAAASAPGFRFAYLAAVATDTPERLRLLAKGAGLRGPILRDGDRKLCAALGMQTTTEVLVLDAARTVVYRGAVSDQYGPTWSLDAPRRSYLADALGAVAAGNRPHVPATTAPGCALEVAAAASAQPVTYHGRVSRIVQANCVECHRKAGLAPFSLETAADLSAHAAMIERVVEAGRMPPWFAAPAEPGKPSRWANDRTLAPDDKRDFLGWLRGRRPAGNPAEAPLARRFNPDWSIGKPDTIFQLPEPVPVKAEGTMPYVVRDVETHFTEDRWVQAIEVAPTDRAVVHHVLVLLREATAQGGADEHSDFFGIYVPGNSTLVYPEGFAKKIPAGARLRFQIHYTPNGKATHDQTRMGLKFAAGPPEHEVHVAGIANPRLSIPAGAADHAESARLPVPMNARILAFLPHMHLRGKAARYEVVAPNGARQTLLDVPKYDFNWQLYYRLAEPIAVRRGSRIEFTGRFDNSAGNPANPDPSREVRWGAQTTDEMLLGYLEFYVDAPDPNTGTGVKVLFKRADRNNDGRVTPDELTDTTLFRRLDVNGDGAITLEEAQARLPGLQR